MVEICTGALGGLHGLHRSWGAGAPQHSLAPPLRTRSVYELCIFTYGPICPSLLINLPYITRPYTSRRSRTLAARCRPLLPPPEFQRSPPIRAKSKPAAGAGPSAREQRPLYLLLPAAGAGLQRLPRAPASRQLKAPAFNFF
jgi:hypothetical protein